MSSSSTSNVVSDDETSILVCPEGDSCMDYGYGSVQGTHEGQLRPEQEFSSVVQVSWQAYC